MPATPERLLPLRIVLRRPPAGVAFALQHGASAAGREPELVGAQVADGRGDLAFACEVRVQRGSDGAPRFLGPFTQGPPSARFVYLVVGKRAGQPHSPWERRLKVPLAGIGAADVEAALAHPGQALEAAIEGTLPDGSPACATRPLTGGWRVTQVSDEAR